MNRNWDKACISFSSVWDIFKRSMNNLTIQILYRQNLIYIDDSFYFLIIVVVLLGLRKKFPLQLLEEEEGEFWLAVVEGEEAEVAWQL